MTLSFLFILFREDQFIDVAGNGVVAVLICSPESSLHHQAFLTSGSYLPAMESAMDSHHLFLLSAISNLNFKISIPNPLTLISLLQFFVGENLSFSVCASTQPISGVVFKPFVEVKKELDLVPSSPELSLA
ncbi:hypothetical protein Bca52824_026713 [Brassica carinata]|uniref:Uncharacterized protein n=1 Tax=Brassica carinata TaxID=52824 RepID=A0A8X7SI83_BRACI|nr:hypothetical protein Bca52824_026713 [Brassica carinata]